MTKYYIVVDLEENTLIANHNCINGIFFDNFEDAEKELQAYCAEMEIPASNVAIYSMENINEHVASVVISKTGIKI